VIELAQMRYLIINADDFGNYSAVNEGIIHGIEKGVITSTSVMVTRKHSGDVRKLKQFPNISIGLHFELPKDGTPVEISLLTGKLVSAGQGHIKVECWTMDQNQDPRQRRFYDWKCRLSIPNGGVVESTREFDFEAPESGYRPFDEINMPMSLGQETWTDRIEKWYFLKLGDGNYARIRFKMMAYGTHGCRIESYLNPDKSRNLEYDRNKEIEVRRK